MFGISFLTNKVVGWLAGGLAVALLAWGGYQFIKLNKVEKTLAKAQAELVTVKADLSRAVEVNRQNDAVIKQLQADQAAVNDALNRLAETSKADDKTATTIIRTIREQASTPANQGTLSPVLQDTITQIQAERNRRAGMTK